MAAIADLETEQQPEWKDYVHTGPGTLGGRYLRMFWQPVCRAEDLPAGRAKPIMVMSEQLTVYRGESGDPHAVAFRCAHRGTQLSTGWVEGDELRCFYHGWKYGPDGQCVEQPAEPEPFCSRIRIRAYPTQQYLGLIFVYFGEGEPPPIPRFSEFENDDEIRDVLVRDPWPCNFFNRIENAPDSAHLVFTHFQLGYEIPTRIDAVETDYGVETTAHFPTRKMQQDYFQMPNISEFRLESWGDAPANRLTWRVPVDDHHYQDVLVTQTHVTGEAAERVRERRKARATSAAVETTAELGEAILAGKLRAQDTVDRWNGVEVEDYATLVGQGAIAPRANDHLGRSDVGVVLIRRLWERELRVLAEGRPIKRWFRPEQMELVAGSD